jgi:hypothetical protein
MRFPTHTYVSTDPVCPPARKHLCIGWLPEKQKRQDPTTGKKRYVWAYGVAGFHYGATPQEAEAKLRVWIEAEREAILKTEIRQSRQQGTLARKRAVLWRKRPALRSKRITRKQNGR